jgi:hypothetical protein
VNRGQGRHDRDDGARHLGAPSGRERREADLFLADLLGPANESEDASGEDQQPSYDLQFIDQRLGGVTPDGPHCAVICPRGLTPARGELDMILYLHGWKPTCNGKDDPPDPKMGQMLLQKHFKSIPSTVGDSGKNVVLVAPTLGPKGEMGPEPSKRFITTEPWHLLNAALAQVQKGFQRTTLKPGKLILAGHSGAGPHILALLNRGDAELSRVIAVWALDSFYGGLTLWRDAIRTNRGITWTIVPSTWSDVYKVGMAIEAEQKSKKLDNQRYLYPGASHCGVPAAALAQLIKEETRLTTRPPAPAPPPPLPARPSESFFESLSGEAADERAELFYESL